MFRVAVVGGGIAGLCAAALLARAGLKTTLFEASDVGGRARSLQTQGFSFNLGPHALYKKGAAKRVLEELGVVAMGRQPPSGALGWIGGELVALPFAPLDAISTRMMGPRDKWTMAKFLGGLTRLNAAELHGTSVKQWLSDLPRVVGDVAGAVVRLTSYACDFERLDAGAAAQQMKLAFGGVEYLHGGWQTMVDGLVQVCRDASVEMRMGCGVREVKNGCILVDGESLEVDAVVLCVAPTTAAKITGSEKLKKLVDDMVPIRAACLDLGLSGLVDSKRRFALGVDEPIYISSHSDVANLAPEGDSLVHAAVYGASGESEIMRERLRVVLDELVPDWRSRILFERWLPKLVVAHDVKRVNARGRGAPIHLDAGIWLAGDWVDSDYMLLDAAVDSAQRAVASIVDVVSSRVAKRTT